jgi:hypothetical protein
MINAIGLVLLGFFSGGLVTEFYLWPPTNSAEWAGWIQALGTIAAIGGCFAVTNHQYKLVLEAERTRHMKTAQQALLNILAIASQAAHLVADALDFRQAESSLGDVPDTPAYRQCEVLLLNDTLTVLASIQLHAIGNIHIVNSLVAMRRIVAQTVCEVEAIGGDCSCGPERHLPQLDLCVAHAREAVKRMEQELGAIIRLNQI